MLAAVSLGPLGATPVIVTGLARDDTPVEYTFRATAGQFVSATVSGATLGADFAITIFDAANTDSSTHDQLFYNDDASATAPDPAVDFVVPPTGGAYRLAVTKIAPSDRTTFALTLSAQDSQFVVPAVTTSEHHRISVSASGVLHIVGDAPLGPKSQLALYDATGGLVTTSGSSGVAGPPRIDQFVLPGQYGVALTGPDLRHLNARCLITPARQPIDRRSVGSGPESICVADLDGDGTVDVVTGNSADDTISVLLGNGDGTFANHQTFSVGEVPKAVAAEDVDGDRIIDIVTANHDGGTVSVLLGNGDGTFGDHMPYAVDGGPISIAIGDVDGDHLPDIVTANADEGTIAVLRGTPDGEFLEPLAFPVGDDPTDVSIADVDGDGTRDIVVVNLSTDNVTLLRCHDGTWDTAALPFIVPGPTAVLAIDCDGDDRIDIVTANSDNTLTVLKGDGRGNFRRESADLIGGEWPVDIGVADFDHDGLPDIAALNLLSANITVFRGLGRGAFGPPLSCAATGNPTAFSAVDLDRDGHIDLAIAGFFGNTVSVLCGNGDGTFAEYQEAAAGDTPRGVVAVDVNDDSRIDLLTATARGLCVLLGNGDGSFATPREDDLGGGSEAIATADLNHDGRLDVVALNNEHGRVSILFGIGDGSFVQSRSIQVGRGPKAVAVGDLDGDGDLDIVAANYGTAKAPASTVSVAFGTRDGNFEEPVEFDVGKRPRAVALVDLDGNDTLEIVTANFLAGTVSVLWGDRGRTFERRAADMEVGRGPIALVAVDIDGRNGPDIVTLNETEEKVAVLFSKGDGSYTSPQKRDSVARPSAMSLGDLDHDETMDIVTVSDFSNRASILHGADDFRRETSIDIVGGPAALAIRDLDRDGRPDVVTANPRDNTVTILQGRGDGTFSVAGAYAPINRTSQAVTLDGRLTSGGKASLALDRAGKVILRSSADAASVAIRLVDSAESTSAIEAFDAGWVITPAGQARMAAIGFRGENIFVGNPDLTGVLRGSATLRARRADVPSGPRSILSRLARGHAPLTDLNGDGHGDIVVSNPGMGTIDVLTSLPDGRFDDAQWQSLPAGAGPTTVLVADLDRDGTADVVSSNQVSGDVSVWLGRPGVVGTSSFSVGAGFGAEFRYRTSSRVYGYGVEEYSRRGSAIVPQKITDIALGDLNADGLVDLVATSEQDRSFSLLRGLSGPDGVWAGFGPPERRTARSQIPTHGPGMVVPAAAHDIVLGNFDRDGRADIALLDRVDERIIVYRSTDAGVSAYPTFLIRLDHVIPKSLQAADVTGPTGIPDGILDLVVGNDFGDVLTLQGVGDGTFKPYVRADRSVALLAADMDGDGKDDFLYGSKGLDRIWLERTASQQSFEADQKQGVLGPSAVATVTETVGGRQLKNLVVANGGANQILVFQADAAAGAAGLFLPAPQIFYVGTNPSAVFVADVDTDGLADVVVANEGSNDVSVMLGMRDGTGRWTLKAGPRLSSGGSAPAGITVSDFAGDDGIPDIAVTNRGSNSAAILRGIAGGFFNDTAITFLPLTIPSPGPIVTLPNAGGQGLQIFVGSLTANQFQSFGQSGSGYTSSGTFFGGGSKLATTTFGGANYLAAGNSATGGVSIFLSGPSSLRHFGDAKALPGLTSLAFDSAGRLFGVSPTSGGALALFGFNASGESGTGSGLNGLLQTAQAFVTRVVFTPLTVAGVGLVAALVTSEGVALGDRTEEAALGESGDGTTADGGDGEPEAKAGGKGNAKNEKESKESKDADAESNEEATDEEHGEEANPLLDFILDAKNLLLRRNRRLIESFFENEGRQTVEGDSEAGAPEMSPDTGEATPPPREQAAVVPEDATRPPVARPSTPAVFDVAETAGSAAPRAAVAAGFPAVAFPQWMLAWAGFEPVMDQVIRRRRTRPEGRARGKSRRHRMTPVPTWGSHH